MTSPLASRRTKPHRSPIGAGARSSRRARRQRFARSPCAIVPRAVAPKIRIGSGRSLPACRFFAAVEKGYFKEAGLDVEALKFAGAQQVMEAMLSGRSDGSSNGTGSANLAIGEIAQPGLFKIFAPTRATRSTCSTSSSSPKDSPVKTMAELKGKTVASGPGIQNVTLCQDHARARRAPADER